MHINAPAHTKYIVGPHAPACNIDYAGVLNLNATQTMYVYPHNFYAGVYNICTGAHLRVHIHVKKFIWV
jgi:hypothetical protein